MNKIIVFSVPSNMSDSVLVAKLDEMMSDLNIKSHAIILTEKDLSCTDKVVHPVIMILKDIIKVCGTGKNRIMFNANFYKALTSGFFMSGKDVKIILTEILEEQNNPEIVEFARINNIPFIFNLAKEALGMIR